jgi:hypothetical protein
MIRRVFAYVPLLLALISAACAPKPMAQDAKQAQKDAEVIRQLDATLKEHEEWKRQHADQLNEPLPQKAPANPEAGQYVRIGMTIETVRKLCGRPDHTSFLQTANHMTESYDYEVFKEWLPEEKEERDSRFDHGCWGQLFFDNRVLVSISN